MAGNLGCSEQLVEHLVVFLVGEQLVGLACCHDSGDRTRHLNQRTLLLRLLALRQTIVRLGVFARRIRLKHSLETFSRAPIQFTHRARLLAPVVLLAEQWRLPTLSQLLRLYRMLASLGLVHADLSLQANRRVCLVSRPAIFLWDWRLTTIGVRKDARGTRIQVEAELFADLHWTRSCRLLLSGVDVVMVFFARCA